MADKKLSDEEEEIKALSRTKFKPITKEAKRLAISAEDYINPIAPAIRMAAVITSKTKKEVIKIVSDPIFDDAAAAELMHQLDHAKTWAKHVADIVAAAEARVLVGMAVLEERKRLQRT